MKGKRWIYIKISWHFLFIKTKLTYMKKCIIFFLFLVANSAHAQTEGIVDSTKCVNYEHKVDSLLSRIDSLLMMNNMLLDQLDINTSLKDRYKLYQTENVYTLLQLDTKTGMIEQVQWSLDPAKEGTLTINSDDLSYGGGYGSNSFELYPTKNMYQFILIDKTNGRKWHVQWGTEKGKRWITRII